VKSPVPEAQGNWDGLEALRFYGIDRQPGIAVRRPRSDCRQHLLEEHAQVRRVPGTSKPPRLTVITKSNRDRAMDVRPAAAMVPAAYRLANGEPQRAFSASHDFDVLIRLGSPANRQDS